MNFTSFKKCFSCQKNYPLFLFYKNNRKYQREDMKGTTYCCRFCRSNLAIKEQKLLSFREGTFVREDIKPSIMNWIKVFLNKY